MPHQQALYIYEYHVRMIDEIQVEDKRSRGQNEPNEIGWWKQFERIEAQGENINPTQVMLQSQS